MPVTPFHFGPGVLLKGGSGRHFSLLLFCATQVVIDFESAYFLLQGAWPVHRFFHTLIGATVLSVTAAFALRPLAHVLLRRLTRDAAPISPIEMTPTISWQATVISALAGVLGHVIPDAIMHADVQPFAPFAMGNPLLHVVPLSILHLVLLGAGLLGGLVILGRAGTTTS